MAAAVVGQLKDLPTPAPESGQVVWAELGVLLPTLLWDMVYGIVAVGWLS